MFTDVNSPYPLFTDVDGQPLESGYIYIGSEGLNPKVNQIQVYWDETLLVPAAQPIRTSGGYPVRNGTPAKMYVAVQNYSILVENKKNEVLYSSLQNTDNFAIFVNLLADDGGADLVGYGRNNQPTVGAALDDVYGKFITKRPLDPIQRGVVYGIGIDPGQRIENREILQSCFEDADNIYLTGVVETSDKVIVYERTSIKADAPFGRGIWNRGSANPTLICSNMNEGNTSNTQGVVIENVSILNDAGDAISARFLNWMVSGCRLAAPNGSCLYSDGKAQTLENRIINNDFAQYTYAIRHAGSSADWGYTDNFIIDNTFSSIGAPAAVSAIDIRLPSGTKLEGNHYYGGHAREYCVLRAGIGVRVIGEYYEPLNNARLRIFGGNPSSISVIGCQFWGGDGSAVDWEGYKTSLIVWEGSEFTRNQMTLSANEFFEGSNLLPIFSVRKAAVTQAIQNMIISFDRNNQLGSPAIYSLMDAPTGLATGSGWAIQSDHPAFTYYATDNADFFITAKNWSDMVWVPTAPAANVRCNLPGDHRVLQGREVVIANAHATSTLELRGNTVPGSVLGTNVVQPGRSVRVTSNGSSFFAKPC